MNGTDLLAEFRESRSDRAFSELVRAYANLVYSVVSRRLMNSALAQEACQTVFLRLAKSVPNLRSDAQLVAWLHRTATHVSIDLWRSETRRRAREQHAIAMQSECTEAAAWEEVAPLLDEAIDKLKDEERALILFRFFEHKTMREVGARFGLTEDAAKMRVSRTVEKLRSRLARKGATCTVAVLAGCLAERSVEAASAHVGAALAALEGSSVVANFTTFHVLGQASRAKLVWGAFSGLLIVGMMFLLLPRSGHRSAQPAQTRLPSLLSTASANPSVGVTSAPAERDGLPDARKLLRGVATARARLLSGEMEFTVSTYHFERPFDGTNVVQLKAWFDHGKRRFDSVGYEYAYVSMEPDTREIVDAKRKAENMDLESATKAALLKGFASHHVTTVDDDLFMDYWEADDQRPGATIDSASHGYGYRFEPRALGLSTVLADSSAEAVLAYDGAKSIQIAGEEVVGNATCWHVRLQTRLDDFREFWIDVQHPSHVLKHTYGQNVVVSEFDDRDPRNPVPREIRMLEVRKGVPRFEMTILCTSVKYNIPVAPDSFTLAGLGMKAGTGVSDNRIHRRIGYWTGAGLSDFLPRNGSDPANSPNESELVTLLEMEPWSAAAQDAALWLLRNRPDGPEVEKAADVILQNHIQSTNMLSLAHELERMRHRCSRRLLEGMMAQNPQPRVRGNACFTLATLQKDAADYGSNKVATAEAIRLFERVISEFGLEQRSSGFTLAELARPELSELQHLRIGQPAPDTQGNDLDDQPLRLSDYRGKALAVLFWGHFGGCRPDMRPLLEAQQQLAEKPFAIVGVFTDQHPEDAKAIADELGMPWRSFKEQREGPIATAWNNHEWPNIWLLDPKGIIRQRNVRAELLVSAVNQLLGAEQVSR